MKCEDALLLISGHIDGENSLEEEQLLQAHLADCEACRAILQAWTEADQGIASLEEDAPADLCEKVMASIGAPKKKQRWWPVLATAAAVALVIGLGSGYVPAVQEEAAMPMTARTASVEFAETADFFPEINGQILSDVRRAYVVEVSELLPEMENCPYEELEDGSLLYLLPSIEMAVELSETYGLELFIHQQAEEAYALLLDKGE